MIFFLRKPFFVMHHRGGFMSLLIIKIIAIAVSICIYANTHKRKSYEENILGGLSILLQIVLIIYPVIIPLTPILVS